MPISALWLLIRPFLPYIAAGLALLAAVWYIDHRGYQRATAEAEARDLKADKAALEMKQFIEAGWQKHIEQIDTDLADRLSHISDTQTSIQPVIRGTRNDPRYTNPACALDKRVLDGLNKARSASHSSTTGQHR